jgi:UDP-glucose 4-epimerase
MRTLITGGAGFIGSHLSRAFIRDGWEVFILDDLLTGQRDSVPAQAALFAGSVADAHKAREILTIVRPDVVVHLAAQASVLTSMRRPAEDATANIVGTINVVQAAIECNVPRIVMASSGGAIYGEHDDPCSESSDADPQSAYGISKLAAEQYARMLVNQSQSQCIALRMGNAYGATNNSPNKHRRLIETTLATWAKNGTVTVFGNGHSVRDYVFINDVVDAFLLAAQSDVDGSFVPLNIGTGCSTSVTSLLDLIQAECVRHGWQSQFHRDHVLPHFGEVSTNRLDVSKARDLIGWNAKTSLARGIESLVSEYPHKSPHQPSVY